MGTSGLAEGATPVTMGSELATCIGTIVEASARKENLVKIMMFDRDR